MPSGIKLAYLARAAYPLPLEDTSTPSHVPARWLEVLDNEAEIAAGLTEEGARTTC